MIEIEYNLIFSLAGALVTMMLLGIIISVFIPAINRWSKHYFITFFSVLLLCTVLCYLALVFYRDPDMAVAERIIYFFESLSLSSLMVMPTVFILHTCGETIKTGALPKVVGALWFVYVAFLLSTQSTDVVYYVTDDNQYFRGPLFMLAMSPLVAIMILNIVGIFKRRKKLTKQRFIALLVYLVPMTGAVVVHMFIEAELFLILGMVLLALVMFGLILADNMERFIRQQREIANQRAGIMVLQMRPHFISNTIMGIYYLCDLDPQKAKQVTLDFNTYLRRNFNAIASEDTIPFTSELEHTRAYLAVEQAQFEDDLVPSFDTPHTLFRLPPLTLQPIVENAVKHGMSATKDPLHICITTRKTDSASEITVEDDGTGYVRPDDSEPHLALDNIRRRLSWMCGGELTISQREGGGTLVKVTIPDKAAK